MNKTIWLQALIVRLAFGPVWLRYGVLLVWAAVLALVMWWLLLQDLQHILAPDGPAQQAEVTRQAERLAAVQRGEQRLAELRDQQAQLSALEAALPAGSEGQSVWAAVHRASRKHGLRMALFKPGPVGSEKPYPQQRAIMRLSGSFDDLLGFTRTLAVSGKAVAFESFSVASSPLDTEGKDSLILEAVLLNLHRPATDAAMPTPAALNISVAEAPSDPVPEAIATTAALTQPNSMGGDPFERRRLSDLSSLTASSFVASVGTSAKAAPAQALQSAPLSSMRLMGSVQSAGHMTALVMAGGMLHAVRVGDLLGNARGQVADIRASDLTVREPGGQGGAHPARVVVLSISKD